MSQPDSPRFTHDCTQCKFLGQFEEYDLYWCPSVTAPTLDSLIARYGSDGPEYLSSHPPGAFYGVHRFSAWYDEILKRGEAASLYDPKIAGTAFKVIVGGLGTVYDQRGNQAEALACYQKYVEESKNGTDKWVLFYAGGSMEHHHIPQLP